MDGRTFILVPTAIAALLATLWILLVGPLHLPQLPSFEDAAGTPTTREAVERARQPGTSSPIEPVALAQASQALGTAASRRDGDLALDIVRIARDGASVFAGQAPQGETIAVLADGKLVGTAIADANGEWILVSEIAMARAQPNIEVKLARDLELSSPKLADASTVAKVALRETSDARREKIATDAVADINNRMLMDLRRMVEEARNGPDRASASATPPAEGLASERTERTLAARQEPGAMSTASGAPAQGAGVRIASASRERDTASAVPIPVHFVYRQAQFTEDGRAAADLLLEYVTLKNLERIRLTGHADDRGPAEFNMYLSQRRLETVSQYLRRGGFKGKIELVAMGETQPFQDIDRSRYSRAQLYQLDRRVELRLAPASVAAR